MKTSKLNPPGLDHMTPKQAWGHIAEVVARALEDLFWMSVTALVLALIALIVAVSK